MNDDELYGKTIHLNDFVEYIGGTPEENKIFNESAAWVREIYRKALEEIENGTKQ